MLLVLQACTWGRLRLTRRTALRVITRRCKDAAACVPGDEASGHPQEIVALFPGPEDQAGRETEPRTSSSAIFIVEGHKVCLACLDI